MRAALIVVLVVFWCVVVLVVGTAWNSVGPLPPPYWARDAAAVHEGGMAVLDYHAPARFLVAGRKADAEAILAPSMDRLEMARLIELGRLVEYPRGTRVRLRDRGPTVCRIEVVDSGKPEDNGTFGYVLTMTLRGLKPGELPKFTPAEIP